MSYIPSCKPSSYDNWRSTFLLRSSTEVSSEVVSISTRVHCSCVASPESTQ